MYKQRIVIGIPTLNGPARLHRCLKSIEDCTNWGRFEQVKVLICDDGSTEENLRSNKDVLHACERIRQVASAEMLMSQTRDGIPKSWNKLARHQPSDIVVLVNDDIEVVSDWLDVLAYSLRENERIGMIGLTSYVGLIKAQVRELHPAGTPDHVVWPRVDHRESRLVGADYLLSSGGSLFAMRREHYDRIGGFDERYFCFYEECDMGVAMRRAGLFHVVSSYPIAFHMGGATLSEQRNVDASAQLLRSRELFIQKWGGSPGALRRAGFPESAPRAPLKEWNCTLAELED